MTDAGVKRRRSLSNVITEDAIRKEHRRIAQRLGSLAREHARLDLPEEERTRILLSGELRAGLAALVYLREHRPKIYSRFLAAAMSYTHDVLASGKPVYRIPGPPSAAAFGQWLFGPSFVGLYDEITRRLRKAWKVRPPISRLATRVFPSPTGRYDESQWVGTKRRHAQASFRAEALCAALGELIDFTDGFAQPVTRSEARRWVVAVKTPSAVTLKALARIMGKTVPSIKRILNRARKQIRAIPALPADTESLA